MDGALAEGEVVERLRATQVYTDILHTMRDPQRADADTCGFFCRECQRAYCRKCWTIGPSRFDGGFYDETYIPVAFIGHSSYTNHNSFGGRRMTEGIHRLLLVEDEPRRGMRYHGALVEAGFEVIRASSGKQALHVIATEEVDLVVTAASLQGDAWIDLVRHVCRRAVEIPVLLMLRVLDNNVVKKGLEAGARQYLVKPDAELLKQTVLQMLRRQREVVVKRFGDPGEGEDLSVPATLAKNAFGELLDKVIEGRRVVITKHATPKAVVLPYAQFQELTERGARHLNTLSAEFDVHLASMQTGEARAGMRAAFSASPAELGKAAVAAARKRG